MWTNIKSILVEIFIILTIIISFCFGIANVINNKLDNLNLAYSVAVSNKEVVKNLDYAIANNIDCSNNNLIIVCNNIQQTLIKNNYKISSNVLFSLYFDNNFKKDSLKHI